MKNFPIKFKVGDIVRATSMFSRKDNRSHLALGEFAEISSVYQPAENSPQIIGLKIKNRLPMGDIVCLENVPLELVKQK